MMLAAMAGLVLAASAAAQGQADSDTATLNTVIPLLQHHQAGQVLDQLAPMIEAHERQIEAEKAKGQVYCATDPGETLSYTLLGAAAQQRAVVLAPAFCHALYFKAFALNDLGRRAEGIAVLERLTALAPMHSQYFGELAYAYAANGKPDLAEQTYRKALQYAEFAPDESLKKRRRAIALRGIGYTLVEMGDLAGAEKAYHDSLKDEPDSAVAKQELEFIAAKRKAAH